MLPKDETWRMFFFKVSIILGALLINLPASKEEAEIFGLKPPTLFEYHAPTCQQVERALKPLEQEIVKRQEEYQAIPRFPIHDWRQRSRNFDSDQKYKEYKKAVDRFYRVYNMSPWNCRSPNF